MDVHHVAILGPGLMGGSILKATRSALPSAHLHVWAHTPAEQKAVAALPEMNATTAPSTVHTSGAQAVAQANIAIICTPPSTVPAFIETLLPAMPPSSLLTDIASVSQPICSAAHTFIKGYREGKDGLATFISSHPMAGSHQSGLEHASASILRGKTCILMPLAQINPAEGNENNPANTALTTLQNFWEALGMRTHISTAPAHDAAVAHTSHLPHAIAAALALTAQAYSEASQTPLLPFMGPGFKSTARVAEGCPKLWQNIFTDNQTEVLTAITHFEAQLAALKTCIAAEANKGQGGGESKSENTNLEALLQTAQTFKRSTDT